MVYDIQKYTSSKYGASPKVDVCYMSINKVGCHKAENNEKERRRRIKRKKSRHKQGYQKAVQYEGWGTCAAYKKYVRSIGG